MRAFRIFVLSGFLAASAQAAPLPAGWDDVFRQAQQQLNPAGFAGCLAAASGRLDFEAIRSRYGFGFGDLLLPYLAVYPGKRAPGYTGDLQQRAHRRWSGVWDPVEHRIARGLLAAARRLGSEGSQLVPGVAYRLALDECNGEAFCAALSLHNVFRTLGRHRQALERREGRLVDHNPSWFRRHRGFWLKNKRRIRDAMISLRRDGEGDRWGEWYHAFGIFTYAFREFAVQGGLDRLAWIAGMNRWLNPILAGGAESPEKARLDRDSVEVARFWFWFDGRVRRGWKCLAPETYVRRSAPRFGFYSPLRGSEKTNVPH